MDTVDDFGKVLLLVEIGQLKNKALRCGVEWAVSFERGTAYLWEPNLPDKIKEYIDVVRMSKIQLWRLHHGL